MHAIQNIAGYKFAALENLKALRERLAERCKACDLKGTILLAAEGINLFVAGDADSVNRLLIELRSIPGMDDLQVKISASDHQPFSRMLAKIKKEIIAIGVDMIDPSRQPAPKISACELKSWLDEGRPFALLDTRNDYEVKLGTFDSALDLGIRHFRDFPDAVRQLPENLKIGRSSCFAPAASAARRPGRSCNAKAFATSINSTAASSSTSRMSEAITTTANASSSTSASASTPACAKRATLNVSCAGRRLPKRTNATRFAEGTSCPYCFVPTDEQRRRALEERQAALRRAVEPLPGSEPYDNYRPVKTPAAYDGRTLLDLLSDIFPHLPREHRRTLCDQGQFLSSDQQRVGPDQIVRAGDLFLHHLPDTR